MIFNCPLLIRALFFARIFPFTKVMKENSNYIRFMLAKLRLEIVKISVL